MRFNPEKRSLRFPMLAVINIFPKNWVWHITKGKGWGNPVRLSCPTFKQSLYNSNHPQKAQLECGIAALCVEVYTYN
jgi:hypothetical protein